MKISCPRFFAFSPYSDKKIDTAKAMSDLGIVPVIKYKDVVECCNVNSASNMSYAVYYDCNRNTADLDKPPAFFIARAGIDLQLQDNKTIIYEVSNIDEAKWAIAQSPYGLIVKGNEASGLVDDDSAFVLFQKVSQIATCPIWLRGGIGVHTSAAAISLGAQGVVLEDECFLFPEFGISKDLKSLIARLDGSETRIEHGHRFYLNAPYWPKSQSKDVIERSFLMKSFEEKPTSKSLLIQFGQSIGLAKSYRDKFSTLSNFITHINWSQKGHLQQAQYFAVTGINQENFKKSFGVELPIAQGPMTRVSDEPEFTKAVADSGALPFFALALLKGAQASDALDKTKFLLSEKKWGVGILGFIEEELQNEQFSYIAKTKPPFVLVAGGNASHVKRFESIGATVFLHAPSENLLDSFLRDGVKGFVFEGRECGGHVGPLSSFVLWEKQINRLLDEQSLKDITIYFAGGVHDSYSAAFISIMSAPLVARGAKVGLLMGTSYLYTKEAVSTGAIQKKYQEELLAHTQTALIESSPGHVVRCLPTPFVDHFFQKKQLLINEKFDSRQIQKELEDLNVGRLRLATKGLKRTENGLVSVGETEQFEDGLYMVGQVATMRKSINTLGELHQAVSTDASDLLCSLNNNQESQESDHGIAIVGMACIFPDAKDIDTYWKNILGNKNCIVEVPKSRWDNERYFDVDAKKGIKSNSKWGGFIPEIEFDPTEFGIPPQSMAAIDPAQLLSLKVTKDALIDSGYWNSDDLDKENTAVIFGLEGGSELLLGYELRATLPRLFGEIPPELEAVLPSLTEDSFSGTLPNVISGRIANRLDFRGRNFVVDAACASSLAAVDIACQELNSRRANLVIAGAVDLHNDLIDYLKFSSVGALSNEGTCKSFAQDAKGIALGEGVGVVILKRLEDAVRDGDKIYSIIKGVGSSSDGKSLGLTAPRKAGQMMAYKRAYKEAKILPAKVGLVEGHGTGTVVGDRTELESLTDFFTDAGAIQQNIGLGSVKTQIGHTKCAAGLAALIKTSLAVYHGIKPATLHLTSPNQYYDEVISPFEFRDYASVWFERERIAGISAFGFGGTNFHLVIQNHIQNKVLDTSQQEWPSELFVIRAENLDQLPAAISRIFNVTNTQPDIRLCDLAYTLAVENDHPIQIALIANNVQDLRDKLETIKLGKWTKDVFKLTAFGGKTAFLFSGQGSQRINMARDLFVAFPEIRSLLNAENTLINTLFPKRSFQESVIQQQKNQITNTQNAQPLLGVVDLAIAKLLYKFGIHPDELAGHSYGEIPALVFAGAIAEDDLISVSKARAESILQAAGTDPGAMVALNIEKPELEVMMDQLSGIYLANHNSEKQWVMAGTTTAVEEFISRLDHAARAYNKLRVACAFHSPVIQGSQQLFSNALSAFEFKNANIPVWSNTTAHIYPSDAASIKQRLCEHLVKPVRFCDQVKAMSASGVNIFIEVGPGKILTNLVSSIMGSSAVALSTESADGHGVTNLQRMLAQYIATGRPLNFNSYFSGRNIKKLDLQEIIKNKEQQVLWRLRGNRADPLYMPMPSNGSKELLAPIKLTREAELSEVYQSFAGEHNVKEKLILDYLLNMRSMIEAQQKVMMSYFNDVSSVNFPSTQLTNVVELPEISTQPLSQITKEITSDLSQAQDKIALTEEKHEHSMSIKFSDIREQILEIICEKTGYPVEMLDDHMDLEADLSIDSIKRTEIIYSLKNAFPILFDPAHIKIATQQLSGLKTIKELIEYLSGQNTISNTHTETTRQETAETVSQLDFNTNIKDILLSIVSERTGYPADMLDMDMDLEADLSIDSIKRTEIINALKIQLTLPDTENTKSILLNLAKSKTLRAIDDALKNTHQNYSQGIVIKKPQAITSLNLDEVRRYSFELVQTHEKYELAAGKLPNKIIGVFEDGSDEAITLHGSFGKMGADVRMVSLGQPLHELDALIYLDLSVSKTKLTQEGFFELTKSLNPEKLQWFFSVTDVYSRIANLAQPNAILNELSGTYGFINSLNKEWPAICREVNVDAETQFNIPELLGYEFFQTKKEETVVFHKAEGRYTNRLIESSWDRSSPSVVLDKDDVVLVLGGAQGITAEILQELAVVSPCKYVLVGRTPVPSFEEKNSNADELSKSITELKQILLLREKFKSPKDLEIRARSLFKENQVILVKKKLESHGAQVYYYSMDLTDHDALDSLIKNVYQKFGKIDGIIHAAGHLEDKLLVDKTIESFNRVLATKLAPLQVLINEFKPSLKYFVLFSSVTSVFGNKGQIDYGTANAVFDQLANALNNLIPGRVVAINWGPWKGKGMIDQALEKDFLRRGVTLISLEEGAKAFMSELQYGKGGQVILMTPVIDMEKAKEQF